MDNSFKNDMSDFFLKEYENIAQAYFNSHELTAKWMRFYLIILAAPFSFIAFIFHNKTEQFDLLHLPNTISILIFVVGVINILLSFIIINARLDTTLYARTVNGIRRYFFDHNKETHVKGLSQYIILPIDTTKPRFLKFTGDLFLLSIFMSLVNSTYLGYGFAQIKISTNNIGYCWGLIIFVASMLTHFFYYVFVAKDKERNYSSKQ